VVMVGWEVEICGCRLGFFCEFCDFCLVGLGSQNPTTSSPQPYKNTANPLSIWVFWHCCSMILVAGFLGGFVTALFARLRCRGSRCRPSWVRICPSWAFTVVGLQEMRKSSWENTEMREKEASETGTMESLLR
jgi:hypothetical protein